MGSSCTGDDKAENFKVGVKGKMLRCRHVTIAVTNDCNMQCKDCYVGQKKEYLDFDKFQNKILKEFMEAGGKSIGFSGGEPLLYPQIFPSIRLAKQNGLETSLVTNGILLTKEKAKKLKDAGLDRIQISLDAGNPEPNDALRQKGAFQLAVCQAVPAAIYAGLRVTLVAVPNTYLLQNLREYLDLAERLKVHAVYFRRRIDQSSGRVSKEEKQCYYGFLEELEKRKENYRFPIYSGDPMQSLVKLKSRTDLDAKKMFAGCSAGITSLAIQPDGDVFPCTRLPVVLGNVYKESLTDIWKESKILQTLRMRDTEGKCGICSFKYVCGGCRAAAYFQYQNFIQEDPMCCV